MHLRCICRTILSLDNLFLWGRIICPVQIRYFLHDTLAALMYVHEIKSPDTRPKGYTFKTETIPRRSIM